MFASINVCFHNYNFAKPDAGFLARNIYAVYNTGMHEHNAMVRGFFADQAQNINLDLHYQAQRDSTKPAFETLKMYGDYGQGKALYVTAQLMALTEPAGDLISGQMAVDPLTAIGAYDNLMVSLHAATNNERRQALNSLRPAFVVMATKADRIAVGVNPDGSPTYEFLNYDAAAADTPPGNVVAITIHVPLGDQLAGRVDEALEEIAAAPRVEPAN